MLVVLPPSETQVWPERGRGLDLARLSFPELTEARSSVLDGMVATSARPDAMRRLEAPAGAALRRASRRVVVDLRSSSYAPLWRPGPELADRWVTLRVPGSPHGAKATRGRVARLLCTEPVEPRDVPALAAVVGTAFGVELRPPARDRAPWVLELS